MPEDLGDIISGVLCSLLKSSTQQSALASENAKWRRLKTGDEMSDATQRQETQTEGTAVEQSRSLNGARGQVLDKKRLASAPSIQLFQPSTKQA